MGSGAAVYADKQNVGYESPFYLLKRVAETARITLTPVEQVPSLHTEFAQRRLDELKAIQTEAPAPVAPAPAVTQTAQNNDKMAVEIKAEAQKREAKMTELKNQMRQEVDDVISEIETKQIKKLNAANLCHSVSSIIKEDAKINQNETKEEGQRNRIVRFEKNCGEFIEASSTIQMKGNN